MVSDQDICYQWLPENIEHLLVQAHIQFATKDADY